ncbi:MAG: hypothetical protein LBB54_04585 [Cellulomonadaceae bacterium]|jgi:hypothetical protein|nr:hypothetical protein [Cellulomonadaceae bacterium]
MAASVGTAALRILPTFEGGAKALAAQLNGGKAGEIAGAETGGKFSSSFGGALKKVGVVAAASLVAAGAGATKLTKDVINQFGQLEQNLGGANAVFGDYAQTMVDKGAQAYKTLGISQSNYLATANKMGALFQGSGVEQRQALDLTSKAMQRAADVASVMGLDMGAAMDSVAGAAKGNFTMMDNLGVAMNATSIEAYALEKGINFKWNVASQAEKSQVAMQMFFDQTAQYAGNFEREAFETISGSLGMLSAAYSNLVAGLGNADADVGLLTDNLVTSFEAVIHNIGPIIENVAAVAPSVITQLVGSLAGIAPHVLDLGTSVVLGLVQGIATAAPSLMAAAVPIVLNLTSGLLEVIPDLTVAGMDVIVALIQGVAGAAPQLIPAAVTAAIGLVDGLIAALPDLTDGGVMLLGGVVAGVITALPDLVDAAPQLATGLVDGLDRSLPVLLKGGMRMFGVLIDAIPKILPPLLGALPGIITGIIGFLVGSIPLLIDASTSALMAIVDAVPQIIPPLIDALPQIIESLIVGLGGAAPQLIGGSLTMFMALVTAAPQIIPPLLGAIGGVIKAIVAGIVGAGGHLLTAGLQMMAPFTRGVKDTLGAAWQWVNDKIFTPLKSALGTVGEAFAKVPSIVSTAWDKIKGFAAKPINFVIETVYGKGIKKTFDMIAEKVGMSLRMPDIKPLAFARGGVMPGYTPGRDVHRFYSPTGGLLDLSGGEAIMRPEWTRAIGGPRMVALMNMAARSGRLRDLLAQMAGPRQAFASGGVFGWAGDAWNWVKDKGAKAWDWTKDAASAVGQFLADPVASMIDLIRQPVAAAVKAIGGGDFGQLVGGMPGQWVGGLTDWVKGWFAGDGKKAVAATGKGAGMGYQKMVSILHSAFPGLAITSTMRPGAITAVGSPSMHGQGRAVDMAPRMDVFNWLAENYPHSHELIFSPAGARQIYKGKPFNGWAPVTRAMHFNHVHWAMANGGVWPGLRIPKLANGGITTGPQLAMIGDNRSRREAIVPLERASEFVRTVTRDLSPSRTESQTVDLSARSLAALARSGPIDLSRSSIDDLARLLSALIRLSSRTGQPVFS